MSLAQGLKRLIEAHGVANTTATLEEAIQTRKIDPYAIRLPDLAETFLGHDYASAERKLKAIQNGRLHMLEASEANDASTFYNITGQLLVTIVKDKYNSPDFIGSKLMRTMPNPGGNLKEHKVPYLSDVDTEPKKLNQLEPYPATRFYESWVTLPSPEKYGHTCLVSMEMVFSDLTGQAQDSAASIGRSLGYKDEVRKLRVILGIDNSYQWNGNSLNTYVDTAGTGNYVNVLPSTTITNYTHINSMEQLFWRMVDPITSRLIYVRPTAVLCMPEKRYELKRILNATETRTGDITSGTGDQVLAPNPLDTQYTMYTSPIARALLIEAGVSEANTKQRIYWGDFQKAFLWREVYPMRVEQAPPQNPYEFQQDVVIAVKASSFGVPGVYDPRYAGQSKSEA
jgi:hypothetical protein